MAKSQYDTCDGISCNKLEVFGYEVGSSVIYNLLQSFFPSRKKKKKIKKTKEEYSLFYFPCHVTEYSIWRNFKQAFWQSGPYAL